MENVIVLNSSAMRQKNNGNIQAAKAVADVIRTTLGPSAALKMILDPMGGIVMTNDGNAILREVDVSHPAAKLMLEISRSQDDSAGDGTTAVIILAGEALAVSRRLLEVDHLHPTTVISGYYKALEEAVAHTKTLTKTIDTTDDDEIRTVIKSTVGTKFVKSWSDLVCNLALKAVRTVAVTKEGQATPEIDIKRYAKVEKIPGGAVEDCQVLNGVMINKDVVHAGMDRFKRDARVVLLDSSFEYKKAESTLEIDVSKGEDYAKFLKLEREWVQKQCSAILDVNPSAVITEKGLDDEAQEIFARHGVSCIRRLRKTDLHRVARVTGATVVHRMEDIKASDVGTASTFEIKEIGDEYFTFITQDEDVPVQPMACSILLRGASKDVLNEIERNLADAMNVARNIIIDPRLLPGGGAYEMALATHLAKCSEKITGLEQKAYAALASSFEVIPRTLAQNCGAEVIRVVTELRSMHNKPGMETWGVDGYTGKLQDMAAANIWDPMSVRLQCVKTAVENATHLLRIDDVISGTTPSAGRGQRAAQEQAAGMDTQGMDVRGMNTL
ncbi:Chaperonin Cpn60/TCP-1 [Carpediemonas membranifera]|uniref:T-complex protein 1 subunit gamma n=1 Tax=Carpediemonas membranifera TaxID=201153 RepID=A0A8J6AXH7_9EUKA|nr:Chaperonin Cpn60/TCP-1 [Carpediemonas membranifera]|eukprot:KAG9390813.1 Chaperonin Cpn60/TCP-1 [Carpediemonas membranifera]